MRVRKPSGGPTRKFERTGSTYDRRSRSIVPVKRILIVCEGEETEPNYFKSLKEYLKLPPLINVKIVERGGAPINLVNKSECLARQIKVTGEPFEAIWCVFDREGENNNSTFFTAVQRADILHYKLAISNPAFEYWYILHFKPTARAFADGHDVKNYLRSHHIPDYEECMPVFDLVCGQTKKAIQHAKQILENHPVKEDRFPNPSTFVHELVEELIRMSPSGRAHLIK